MKDLPKEYDLTKEPVAKYRLSRRETEDPWSGRSYVVVLLNGEMTPGRVRIASPNRCDHGETICTGKHSDGQLCAVSWQYDYSILWSRTSGGRDLLAQLGIEADRHQNPDNDAARWNAKD